MKFALSIEEHAYVMRKLSEINANKELALLTLLGYEEDE